MNGVQLVSIHLIIKQKMEPAHYLPVDPAEPVVLEFKTPIDNNRFFLTIEFF